MLTGKILWISERDGNGIILSDNREFYFDSSTAAYFRDLKRGDEVKFDHSNKITDCLCARNIIRSIFLE